MTRLGRLRQKVAENWRPFWRRIRKHKLAVAGGAFFLFLIFLAVFAPLVAPHSPYSADFEHAFEGPTLAHPLGTDEIGRDVLSRIIFGTRLSLAVGVISVALALVIGVFLGAVAGFFGGWVDNVIMRAMDVLLAFPAILLAIAIMVLLGPGLEKAMVAIGIVSIPGYARIVRGSVMSIKENEYIEASRAIGLANWGIIWKHVLPNILAPIIVRSTLGVSEAILDAAALGFLGLGAQAPKAEWGAMLSRGKNYLYTSPHLVYFPGVMITITVLSLNLFGDGLRDALDPRLKV
ncbi:MAG TPA: ABC transporter permease [Bacillota bacterium]|jgi:peptide/nickel transport system permease protein/oligopeptide transport system permease protein